MNEEIRNRVHDVLVDAESRFGLPMVSVTVKYDLRGLCAGQAQRKFDGQLIMRLNPEAYEKDPEHFLYETIPHEVAHLACHNDRRLGKNHNAGWKRTFLALGGKGARCHNIALTKARNVRKYWYRATCGTMIEVTSIRHNKVRRGTTYRLKNTGGQVCAEGYVRPSN